MLRQSHMPVLPSRVMTGGICFSCAVLSALVFCAISARSDIVIGAIETWGSGTQGWASSNGVVSLGNSGGGDPYLQISFAQGTEPPDPTEAWDVIYTYGSPATNLFTGNYSVVDSVRPLTVRFNFLADDVAPSDLELRFDRDGRTWSYNLTPAAGWSSYSVPLDYAGWADGPGSDEADFLADLEAVDWIGIYIQRSGTGPQDYGLDDFELTVPEPGELYLLATALSGLTLSFRRRLRGLISLVRTSA